MSRFQMLLPAGSYCFLLLLLLTSHSIYAQNLVDGDFSAFSKAGQQKNGAIGYADESLYLERWHSPVISAPVLVETAEDGTCMELVLRRGTFVNEERIDKYRNYAAAETSEPLEKEVWYKLKFEMKTTPDCNVGMMGIQVHFNEDKLLDQELTGDCLTLEPHLKGDDIVLPPNQFDYYGEWQKKEKYYRAKGGEQYLIFGLFCGKKGGGITNLSRDVLAVEGNPWNAVYWLRNVSLEKIPPPEGFINDSPPHEASAIHDFEPEDIVFPTNGHALGATDRAKLDRLIAYLETNKEIVLQISGYADRTGTAEDNMLLSQRRAATVGAYFTSNGIAAERLLLEGKGSEEAYPLSFGEAFLQKDRRVSFEFVSPTLTTADLHLLNAFTKIYGYLRFFYPNPDLEKFNWTDFAVFGVNRILLREEHTDDATLLRQVFLPIAPDVFIANCPTASCKPPTKPTDTKLPYWVWQHRGLQSDMNLAFGSKRVLGREGVTTDENRLFDTFPEADEKTEVFFSELGIKAIIPISWKQEESQTISLKKWNIIFSQMRANRRSERIASAVIVWNAVQHFFPYLEALQLDWQARQPELLLAAATAVSELDYEEEMKRILTVLQDGHGRFMNRSALSEMWPQATFAWVEDRLVIKNAFQHEVLQRGDEVVEIDHENAVERFMKDTSLISGSAQWKVFRALDQMGSGKHGERFDITVNRNGTLINTTILRDWVAGQGISAVEEVEDGIFFIRLSILPGDSLLRLVPRLAADAKAIILDARGYPPIDEPHFQFLEHFLSAPDSTKWIYSPQILYPDQKDMVLFKSGVELSPRLPQLQAQLVLLSNGGSLSACETYLSLVKHLQLGTIIGSQTAGANGGANRIFLPNDYRFNWTGEYVTLLDGTYYHGIGIPPDIVCEPKLADIKQGNDTLLARAVYFLTNQN